MAVSKTQILGANPEFFKQEADRLEIELDAWLLKNQSASLNPLRQRIFRKANYAIDSYAEEILVLRYKAVGWRLVIRSNSYGTFFDFS